MQTVLREKQLCLFFAIGKVLLEGLVIAGIGVGSGLLLGYIAELVVRWLLADVQWPGAVPVIVSAMVILAAAVIASVMPAARAARVDAVEALRSE